jgi:hypothetical protein
MRYSSICRISSEQQLYHHTSWVISYRGPQHIVDVRRPVRSTLAAHEIVFRLRRHGGGRGREGRQELMHHCEAVPIPRGQHFLLPLLMPLCCHERGGVIRPPPLLDSDGRGSTRRRRTGMIREPSVEFFPAPASEKRRKQPSNRK